MYKLQLSNAACVLGYFRENGGRMVVAEWWEVGLLENLGLIEHGQANLRTTP
jgi:hypothetical protein